MAFLQRAIEAQVHRLVGFGEGATDLDNPPGDPGLFGPGSAAWRVHGDFTAMITGGIAALFLQMLHPRALAGVWDHSRWREDTLGRLKRTAQFVGGTTYGGTGEAERLIAKVRAIHAHVRGTLPDGTSYSAEDPDLLAWVHVTEMRCFLEARIRYGPDGLEPGDADLYFAETAVIARKLGATWLPDTRAEADAYLERTRPELRHDDRTRQVAEALLRQSAPNPLVAPAGRLFLRAGIALLPDWAARMHGFRRPQLTPLSAWSLRRLAGALRWAIRDGSPARGMRRAAALDKAGQPRHKAAAGEAG
ncbi:MAG: DUF2236 domain-containing protein [Alphaproteobacteria bacterium]|nr:DUF2236 domain-containing protein [Alphaproteobacteria bacterium]